MSQMLRRLVAVGLVMAVVMSGGYVSGAAAGFRDISESYWARESILDMVNAGVVQGYADQTFRPGLTVTRAELAAFLTRAAGLTAPPEEAVHFADVVEGLWYSDSVAAAGNYLSGYPTAGGIQFKPKQAATRAEITVAIVKLLVGHGTKLERDTSNLLKFNDWKAIPDADRPYISEAIEQQIVNGFPNATLRPNTPVTRAEAIAILWNAYDRLQAVAAAAQTQGTLERFEGRWRNIDMSDLEFTIDFTDAAHGVMSYSASGETFTGNFRYNVLSETQLELTLIDDEDGTKIMLSGDLSTQITIDYGGELYRLVRME